MLIKVERLSDSLKFTPKPSHEFFYIEYKEDVKNLLLLNKTLAKINSFRVGVHAFVHHL